MRLPGPRGCSGRLRRPRMRCAEPRQRMRSQADITDFGWPARASHPRRGSGPGREVVLPEALSHFARQVRACARGVGSNVRAPAPLSRGPADARKAGWSRVGAFATRGPGVTRKLEAGG